MLIYEYKIDANKQQRQAIENALRVCQFIRNKCLRLWMDSAASLPMTYRFIAQLLLVSTTLRSFSTHKPVKPVLIGHGLLFNASMRTARTRKLGRKAIRGFNTITEVWSTSERAGS